jgi:predicted ATP-dependent Lon-type protease
LFQASRRTDTIDRPRIVAFVSQALRTAANFYIPGWEMPKMKVDFFTNHYGFVVDYLAEALRELRKHTFTEVLDRNFSLRLASKIS